MTSAGVANEAAAAPSESSGSAASGRLAWLLAWLGAVGCTASAAFTIALGLASVQLIVTAIFVAIALLGGLVAARRPDNTVGWLMVGTGLVAVLMFLPTDYGYAVTVERPGVGPLGIEALWLGAWSWTPLLGVVLPLIATRFPDGHPIPRWRWVDWIVAIGTLGFALSIALAPGDVLAGYLPISQAERLALLVRNPLGEPVPAGILEVLRVAAVVVIVVGYAAAIASLIDRFRHASGDEQVRILWFGYAVGLVGVAAFYALAAWGFLGAAIGDALLPLDFLAFGVPLAVAVGILRYQLFDIELVISRTLVYGLLTALLAAAYTATITLLQRLLVGASGTTSTAVYAGAAFVVVIAFSPVRDWLQHHVDRRLGRRKPIAVLDDLRASIAAVLDTLEPSRAAGRLLDEAIDAFEARGGALYLGAPDQLQLVRGQRSLPVAAQAQIRHDGRILGRIELGPRRGGRGYSDADRKAIQETADAVGGAIGLGERLGL